MKKILALATLSFLTSAVPLKAVQIDLVDVLNGDREKGEEVLRTKIQKKQAKVEKATTLVEAYKDEITIFQMALEGLGIHTAEIRDGLAKALQGMYAETRVSINYGKEKPIDTHPSVKKTSFLKTPQKVVVSDFDRNHETHATGKLVPWAMDVEETLRFEKAGETFTSLQQAIKQDQGLLLKALECPIRRQILNAAFSLVTDICPLIYKIEEVTGQKYQTLVSSSRGGLDNELEDQQQSKAVVKQGEEQQRSLVAVNDYATAGSLKLKHTGKPKEVREENRNVTVTTDHNAFASYQLEGDRVSVKEGQTIEILYTITVQPGGKVSLGFLNMARNGWYGAELVLTADHEAKTYEGVYERIVPQGEKETSLVFRNYHLPTNGGSGQSIFVIKDLDFKVKDH